MAPLPTPPGPNGGWTTNFGTWDHLTDNTQWFLLGDQGEDNWSRIERAIERNHQERGRAIERQYRDDLMTQEQAQLMMEASVGRMREEIIAARTNWERERDRERGVAPPPMTATQAQAGLTIDNLREAHQRMRELVPDQVTRQMIQGQWDSAVNTPPLTPAGMATAAAQIWGNGVAGIGGNAQAAMGTHARAHMEALAAQVFSTMNEETEIPAPRNYSMYNLQRQEDTVESIEQHIQLMFTHEVSRDGRQFISRQLRVRKRPTHGYTCVQSTENVGDDYSRVDSGEELIKMYFDGSMELNTRIYRFLTGRARNILNRAIGKFFLTITSEDHRPMDMAPFKVIQYKLRTSRPGEIAAVPSEVGTDFSAFLTARYGAERI